MNTRGRGSIKLRYKTLCFFGPDGSGKTTLAKLLKNELMNRGVDAAVVWVRGTHTFASIIARLLSSTYRGGKKRKPCNPYYGFCAYGRSKYLWSLLEILAATPVMIWRFFLTGLRHDLLIAERSPPDMVVWLVLTFGGEPPPAFALAYTISMTSKVCERLIYVRANDEVLARRRPKDIETNKMVLPIYDGLASILRAYVVDTSDKSPREALDEVLEVVSK